ncbi:DUF2066 domain-containing protein [uncultured Paraglaciecola sp.]|uniref:DUF2066 domain-containing protein n=1 Tax=uncultured Paraglaciecola sp. TaxID=1765024 RepID=UPI0030D9D8C3|tara:strand:- start:47948 stop:49054 length:1107 start_codon:yes stop_codon:yes gene_type:complete
MPIKINPVLLVLLLVWLVSWQNVKAAVIEDLYDAKIAVDNQSQTTQNNAFSLALKQVLVKVRGNTDLLSNQKIRSALTKATRFVRSYSYEKVESQLFLVISFDPQRVENAIRNAGFPVWDKRRPDSLIWLAIQTSGDSPRQMATHAEFSDIYQQLKVRAAQRGISLMFPLWDLDDIQTLRVYDIWGGFSTQISKASERYVVPSILSARIYPSTISQASDSSQNSGKAALSWSADWTMLEGGGLLAGQVQGDSQLNIAERLIDALADQLSSKYAIDLAQIDRSDSKVQIVVNNIDSLNYYSLALRSLENMSVVNDVILIKQQGSRATFELDLLGDIEDLTNALSLDSKIRPVVDDFGQPILGLEFFWVK